MSQWGPATTHGLTPHALALTQAHLINTGTRRMESPIQDLLVHINKSFFSAAVGGDMVFIGLA
jgi:hypothetical protein